MSNGWKSGCQSPAPLSADSTNLDMPLESEETLAHCIERLIDEEELSSLMVSHEISSTDLSLKVKPGSVEASHDGSTWQDEMNKARTVEDESRDTESPNQLVLSGGNYLRVDTDSNSQNTGKYSALLNMASPKDYSDISNSSESETDLRSIVNSCKDLNTIDQSTETQGVENCNEATKFEQICSPSFLMSSIESSLALCDNKITPKEVTDGVRPQEALSELERERNCLNSDAEGREQERSPSSDLEDQNSNATTQNFKKVEQSERKDLTKSSELSLDARRVSSSVQASNPCAFESTNAVEETCSDGVEGKNQQSHKTGNSPTLTEDMSSKHMVEQGVDFNSASENVVCEDSQKDPLDNCSREEEPSSFAFLESCFGFKNSEHDSKIIPQHANLNLNEETDISEGREANQGSQGNRPCNAEPPIVVKSGCESISRDQDKKEADGEKTRLLSVFYNKIPSSLVPEMQSEQIGSTSATEEQNGDTTSTETQNESGITRKSITQLLSCQKLQKKLQPVVLLKTKEPCTKERMFHCAKCKETAQSLDQLIEHHHGTHPNTDFQYCLTCGFYFTNDSFAWQHLCDQTEQNGYHLSCPTQLHANSSLERPNAKYKCEYCGKPFFKRIRKEEHEHRHRTVTPHRCDNCGLYFTQFGTLNRHKKRVQCFPLIMAPNKQSEVTSNTSLLKESVTPLVDTSLSKLLDCFVKLVDCMKNQIPLPITCQVCGRSFRLRAQLNTHLRTHANEKPFECSACLKAFKYPWNLKRHKREQCTGHSISQEGSSLMENKTQGQFKCPICPRMFKQSYTRLRHLREQCLKEYTRTGSGKVNNRYKCPLCNQTFSLASNRSRHIRIVCFKQYKLLGNSQTNKEAQEDLAEVRQQEIMPQEMTPSKKMSHHKHFCQKCPAAFAYKSGLYRHKKRHEVFEMSGEPYTYKHAKKRANDTALDPSDKGGLDKSGGQLFSCRFCGKCFGTNYSLKKHIRQHKGDKPFRCLECGKCFARHGYLLAHKNVHRRRIQCSVCKKILPTIGDLLKHRQSHINKGMLHCPDCPMQFKFPVFLIRHLKTHENKKLKPPQPSSVKQTSDADTLEMTKDFMCAICKMAFNDAEGLSKHCLSHLPKPTSSRCQFCRRSFHSRAALIRHIRLHTGEKPFPCQKCGKHFYRPDFLKPHLERCTGSQRMLTVEKPVTEKNQGKFKDTVMVEVKKPYKCPYCPHSFVWASSLTKHKRGHVLKEVFPCSKCSKCFMKVKLEEHEKTCNGKEPTRVLRYACRNCGTTYSRKDNRNVHEKKCQGLNRTQKGSVEMVSQGKDKRGHRCPFCFKYFKYRSFLLRHTPVHSREKPYTCMHCGQKYASQRRYLQHEAFCDGLSRGKQSEPNESEKMDLPSVDATSLKNVSPSKGEKDGDFKCKFCTKTFSKSRYLRRHILTHTEVKPYRCKTCDSCFSRHDHLKLHQTRCRGKRQRLEVCIEKISLDEVGTGRQTKLQKEGEPLLECKICTRSFTSKANLARHNSMLHVTGKAFSCRHCGNTYSSQKSLNKHNLFVRCKKSSGDAVYLAKAVSPVQSCRETSKLLQRIQSHYADKLKFQCAYCPRRFKNQGQVMVHTRLHTGEKPFGCADCGERFIRRDYLKRHLVKCNFKGERQERVLCDRCGDLFTKDSLSNHQKNCVTGSVSVGTHSKDTDPKASSKIKGFSCTNCSCRFLLFSQLQQHFMSKHRDDTLQKSDEMTPDLLQQLSGHMQIKEEPSNEGYIEKQTSSSQVQHRDQHLNSQGDGKKRFVCTLCDMRFMNNSGLGMHMRAHKTTYIYPCENCNNRFSSEEVLQRHFRKCQEPLVLAKKEPGECSVSQESQSTSDDTVLVFNTGSKTTGTGVLQTNFSCKDHEKGNTTGKDDAVVHKYQCSECDQSFTDGLKLISHLEDHGREEQERKLSGKYSCSECGKSFSQPGLLSRHVKYKHKKRKPHACPECFKGFRCPSDLDVHRSCHDPNRPFVCSTCQLRFWTAKSLHIHQARHARFHSEPSKVNESSRVTEGGSPIEFSCQLCERSYATKKSYMRHCREKHKKESEIRPSDQEFQKEESKGESDTQNDDDDDFDGEQEEDDSDDNDSDSAPYFPCHVCGKTFLTSENLEDHQRCHLGEKPHECAQCGKCFVQLVNLQQHERSHKSEFQCQVCNRGFVSLFALRKHKHSHGRKRPHRCTKCPLSFSGVSHLAEHLATHRDENFPCDLCDRTFSCKISRAEHRKIHTEPEEELPPLIPPRIQATTSPLSNLSRSSPSSKMEQFKYRCGICHERFCDPEQLTEHGCKAAKERPYSCPKCNKHFLHGSHLKKHQLSHQLSGVHSYQCDRCHMSFRYQHHFLNHLRTHGNDNATDDTETLSGDLMHAKGTNENKIYKCPICPHGFSQAMELANHLSVHSHMCNVCNMTFASKKQLAEHEKCHLTAATQYECTECGDSFLGSDAFRQHRCAHRKRSFPDNAHPAQSLSSAPHKRSSPGVSAKIINDEEEEVDVGEDFYNCLVCDKRFSSNISFLEHQKQHTDERPYKCLVCGKSFAKKRYLVQHQHIHLEQSYHCDVCTQSFRSESSLLSHKKMHSENRQHKCSVCNKSYLTAYDLSRHKQRHAELQNKSETTGDHRCDMCYKSFSQLSQLRKHRESHVGQVVYECTECDKAFAFFHLLEEHQRTHFAATESLEPLSLSHSPLQSPVTE